jgi:putative PIN family toxin of toxin-antitoxin system
MRVVLDTNILARCSYRLEGPAAEVLDRVTVRPHLLILSAAILKELHTVLGYPRFRQFHKLSDEMIARFIARLQRQALVLDPVGDQEQIMDDPRDVAVIAAAVAGRANVICTLDRHFYQEAVTAYCRQQGLEITDDIELLRRLRSADQ